MGINKYYLIITIKELLSNHLAHLLLENHQVSLVVEILFYKQKPYSPLPNNPNKSMVSLILWLTLLDKAKNMFPKTNLNNQGHNKNK